MKEVTVARAIGKPRVWWLLVCLWCSVGHPPNVANSQNRAGYEVPGTVASSVRLQNPQLSPGLGEWLSFQTDEEGTQHQHIVNLATRKSYEIAAQRSETRQVLDPGSSADRAMHSGGLVWCPRMIEGEQWFVFVGSRDGNVDLYAGSVKKPEAVLRLTSDGGIDDQPVWSPDGMKLAFTSRRSGGADIYAFHDLPTLLQRLVDLAGEDTRLAGDVVEAGKWFERVSSDERDEVYPAWLSDRAVVFTRVGAIGEKWRSKLIVKNLLQEKSEVEIAKDTLRIMRNASVSPRGKWLAYYRSLGMKPGDRASLVVGQLQYELEQVDTLKIKWPRGVRRFEDVEERIEGGPYWTGDGSLLLLNDKAGKANVIYEIPSREFEKEYGPQIVPHEFINQEFNIRGVCTRSGPEKDFAFVAQVGSTFGVFWTQWKFPPPPPPPAGSLASVGVGATVYQYMGNAQEATPGFGTMLYGRYPLGISGFSITGGLESGYVRGSSQDQNGKTWKFVSPFYAVRALLNRRVVAVGPLDVAAEAGAGLVYVRSKNEETQGAKAFFPVGVAANVRLMSGLGLVVGAHLNFSTGDLDGLHADKAGDRFLDVIVGLSIF